MQPYWLVRHLYRGTTRLVVEECAVLTVRDALDGHRTDAELVTVPQRIGTTEKGVRHWLICPDCASRRAWLLLLDDGGLSCRVCCGVPYRSQHLSRGTRLRYWAYGLAERLGGLDESDVLRKPPTDALGHLHSPLGAHPSARARGRGAL